MIRVGGGARIQAEMAITIRAFNFRILTKIQKDPRVTFLTAVASEDSLRNVNGFLLLLHLFFQSVYCLHCAGMIPIPRLDNQPG